MCLKPIKIQNPAKRFDLKGGQPLLIEVPCGKCAECKKNKRLEWYFRAYHQCQDTIYNGGYVYFDTLTYADEYIPKLSHYIDMTNMQDVTDFTCFNHEHWRNFLKNMRRQLFYHYRGANFKYFLTSEYGTDPTRTHRPHYHILFFVHGNIEPFAFSRLVSQCWQFGRTDGLPYQNERYVAEHCYGDTYGYDSAETPFEICSKICNYVSKYVTKDSTFQQQIDNRIQLLRKHIKDDAELKNIIRSVDMFHRCSQGFGLGYLRRLDVDERNFIFDNGACRVGDKARIKYVIKLPLYFKRKLFYDCLKRADNTIYWQLNAKGVEYQKNHLLKCVDKVAINYKLLLSLASHEEYNHIKLLMNGRSIDDFVIYKIFYKNRCRDIYDNFGYNNLIQNYYLNETEDNLHDWLCTIIDSSYVNSHDNFSIVDSDEDKKNIILNLSFGNLFDDEIDTLTISKQTFIKNFKFNENSCTAFANFDKVDVIFNQLKQPSNKSKQQTFDFIEELTKKFKTLYYE